MPNYPAGISKELFIDLAREAGRIQLEKVVSIDLAIEIKSDNTPVTEADTAINALVIEEIRKRNQEVSIRGEEMSDLTDSPYLILLDPIDGTQPFIRREPVFTFCMALLFEGEPILAVTFNPSLGKMYHAERGSGTWLNNDTRLHVNSTTSGGGSPLPSVSIANWKGAPYHMDRVEEQLKQRGFQVNEANSIANSMAEVAEGISCGTFFPAHHSHDTAPGALLIAEAGGVCTNIFGQPQRYDGFMQGHLSSNGLLQETFMEIVRAANP